MHRALVIRRLVSAECIVTIEVRQWLPAAAFLLSLLWYLAVPSREVAMGMMALAGILLCGYGWAEQMGRRVRGKRVLRYYAFQVGDQLEEEITLTNHSILPVLWAEFTDRSDLPGYTASGVRAVDSGGRVTWRVGAICARRGTFVLGPWEMQMGDPFGLFRVRQVYLEKQEILVYPPLAELPEHLAPHSGVQGDMRPLRQPLHAETTDATATRPYAPGDPIRHIHWPTTARKAEPYIKSFQPEAATSVWLVPDCDARFHLGEGPESTFETMVLVTASLAARLLNERLSVGMLMNGAEKSVVSPQRGQQQLWNILKALAPVEPVFSHPLSETLDSLRQLITAQSMFIVITPSIQPDWLPQLIHLAGARSRGRAEMILLDPASFGGSQSADALIPLLTRAGVLGRILKRGQIKPVIASYGELSRWEFTSGATGRAIVRKTPRQGLPGSASSTPVYRRWKDQA